MSKQLHLNMSRRFKPGGLLLPLLFILTYPVMAEQPCHPKDGADRPAIGLVLSGGGARGAAHVGVIRVLEELNIPIDCITGTSMGSIIGGLYASGMTSDELEQTLLTLDWDDALQDEPRREDRPFRRKREDDDFLVKAAPGVSDHGEIKLPSGFIQGQKLGLVMKELTLPVAEIDDFDQLSIPFRAVATDIVTGHEVVLGSGDLATAMRASMSVPGAFSAVEIGGQLLVDGGMANNLPVSVAREMGADIVIAVDISTPLANRDEIKNVLSITKQLTGFLTNANAEVSRASLTDKDILIVPDLGDITSGDFDRADEAIPTGRVAAKQKVPQLRRLSLTGEQFTAHVAARSKRVEEPPVIEFVRIDNRSRISDDVIQARLRIKIGEPLDVPSLEKDLNNIYGANLYQGVSYDIVEEDGKTGVVVTVVEKSWGPNYLQGGLALEGNFSGSNSFTIAGSYTRTAMNRLGGEWRTIVQLGNERRFFTEWYQPLDYKTRWFVNPKLEWRSQNFNQFDSGDKIAEYDISRFGVSLEAGRELGFWGELRGGVRWATGKADLEVGDTALPSGDFDKGEAFLRLSLDTFNNAYFPHSGVRGQIEYLSARDFLGADEEYEQVLSTILGAFPLGERNSLILGARFNTTLDDDAPIESLFRGGGFLQLSGFEQNEITGQQLGLLEAIYLRRINDFNLLPTYLGASLELGNAWDDTSNISWDNTLAAGSLFLGVDSFLGPVYIGYGYTEGGNHAGFLFLGNPF
ncbi:MAG: patatin-like phospholipase family protein [Gammaproteobacteria bacterium]